ncbi:AAA domain-containing protein [Butyrivibrio sp. TB]|uniref:AAA domain-containing protein n=1 Tax=Butyrivibrio sp. TB TaxID=1520809 RepID=UPI0008D84186|nr:AAA domain-containing protein [Butyrivibrio sp. TB]SEP55767.1 Superfamily I DNA and/or RNA helicase [Butyrivibrio sp. TB]
MDNKYNKSENIMLEGRLAEFVEALQDEQSAIEKNGQSSILLHSGQRVEHNGADFWYRFLIDYMPSIPADTPCNLIVEKNSYKVTVVSVDESEIIISAKEPLPPAIALARIENGSTVLIERMIERIEDSSSRENPVGERMLDMEIPFKAISDAKVDQFGANLNEKQEKAVLSAITNNITFIWGPPGTGKTTVIGTIIKNLYKNKRSVLVVSHTNTAVDGAIEKVLGCGRDDRSNPVLRIGQSQKELPECVSLEYHVKNLGKELYGRQENLKKLREELLSDAQKFETIISEFNLIELYDEQKFDSTIKTIAKLSEEIKTLEGVYLVQQKEADKYKEDHPEILDYERCCNKKEQLKNDLETNSSQIKELKEKITQYKKGIGNAKDELLKHTQFISLSERIDLIMSEEFLTDNIKDCENDIVLLTNDIKDAETKINELTGYIEKNSKRSLTAFIYRNKLEESENERKEKINKKRELETKLAVCQEIKDDYSSALKIRRSLCARRAQITPSYTKEYWEDTVINYSKNLSIVEENLQLVQKAYDELDRELSACKSDIDKLLVSVNKFKEINNTVKATKSNFDKANKNYKQISLKCKEEIEILINAGRGIVSFNDEKSTLENAKDIMHQMDIIANDVAGKDKEEISLKLRDTRKEIYKTENEIREVQELINNLEKEAIMKAQIVGATLTTAYLNDVLQERGFDTVILDEASMAQIPALWCASYAAKNNIVIVGDFLQLPPIVMANTPMAQKWLKRDVFAASGIQESAKKGNVSPDNFIMLDKQYRMESEIADIANLYYKDYEELKSPDNKDDRVKIRNTFYEWFSEGKNDEHSVEIIDTSEMHAWVTSVPRGRNASRLNCFSAALTVEMAFTYALKYENCNTIEKNERDKPKVLIIAPYKPHIDRVTKLIELGYKRYGLNSNSNLIKAGTIHSFQGNEADIVIFDLVIDEPHFRAGLFSAENDLNENMRKLFNVAVTRAKFKLYLVGNIGYCKKRAKNNALSELLESLVDKKKLPLQNANLLFPKLVITMPSSKKVDGLEEGSSFICTESEYMPAFMEDLRSFKSRLVIFSPFITANRLAQLLPEFHDAINMGKEIMVITRPPSDRGKRELPGYIKCVDELEKIGVKVIYKKNMHEKIVIIDDSAYWYGSLNTLSFTGFTSETMTKLCSSKLTMEMEQLYGIPKIQTAIDNEYELKCPICSGNMFLGEADKGGFYWKCAACGYSRSMDQQYPVDGILRCHCGSTYHFDMKNQPRWVCDENRKHYQKMRYGDLRLEKMKTLLSDKDLKRVESYFAEKKEEFNTLKKEKTQKQALKKEEVINKTTPNKKNKIEGQITLADLGLM